MGVVVAGSWFMVIRYGSVGMLDLFNSILFMECISQSKTHSGLLHLFVFI